MQDTELLQSFLTESTEMLDEVEPKIIEIQQTAESTGVVYQETINSVFRLFHSIKGSAGFLQLANISSVTHEAETLLDLFRKGKARVTASHTQLLCRACDYIREMLARVAETQMDSGAEDRTKALVKELSDAIAREKGAPPTSTAAPAPAQPHTPAPAPRKPAAVKAHRRKEPVVPVEVAPEMIQIYVGDADEILEKAEHALMAMEKAGENPAEPIAEAFRAFHTFKGNSGLLGLVDLEQLSHKVEEILGYARDGVFPLDEACIRLMLKMVDVFRRTVSSFAKGGSASILGVTGMMDLLQELIPASSAPEEATAQETPDTQPAPSSPQEAAATPPPAAAAAEPAEHKKGPEGEMAAAKPEAAATSAVLTRRDIRVGVEKLDVLTNLVGELVIAEAMVTHNTDLAGLRMDNFERAAHQLNRITSELQDIAMSLRMVPVESTFRKMIRLVHDLSAKAGKKVDLKLVGEETEVDRTVAELISDPLVHMVRNSVDHGIELPADRVKAGKPENGSITIEARYQAGEVWILIIDNGRGLNRDKILSKAIERGLVQAGANLRDDEIFGMIFLPGFSTADKVTDVSGRGVGMDVVKKNIEKIRGRVDIQTTPGQGTRFTIRIPLTLAIIQGMLVRVAQERYIIPLLHIRESLVAADENLSTVVGKGEMIKIRGELLPVFRLARLFKTKGAIAELNTGIIVVVEAGSDRAAILVDELLGQQQTVIKSLGDMFGEIRGVSGASIMSDGRIGLILDIEGIVKIAHES
ncbi:MAG: chemotaxis protein CheA [Lentisphaerota bacterium]